MRIRESWVLLAAAVALAVAMGCGESVETAGPANDPPVLAAVRDTTIALGDTVAFFVSATDPDGDDITYSLGVSVTWEELQEGYRVDASLDSETGYFRFRPKQEDVPDRDFNFAADDGRGGEDDVWMTVRVTGSRQTHPDSPAPQPE
jgi:hypothetical protein